MQMTVTLRVQVHNTEPLDLTVELPDTYGDNPRFVAADAEQAALVLVQRVKAHLEMAYGKTPVPAVGVRMRVA